MPVLGDGGVGSDWRVLLDFAVEYGVRKGRGTREWERQVVARVEDRKPVVRCNLKLVCVCRNDNDRKVPVCWINTCIVATGLPILTSNSKASGS